ncbi:MAG: hypothetical protein RLZ04_914 [Actinomycetota bacterium]
MGRRGWRMRFVVGTAVSALLLVVLARRGGFLLDDFNVIGSRWHLARDDGWWSAWMAPHNRHWSTTWFVIHHAALVMGGLRSYWAMAVLSVGSVVLVVVAVRTVMLRAGVRPWLAATWPITLFWWGTAPLAVLWGFDAVFTLAEAAILVVTAMLLPTVAAQGSPSTRRREFALASLLLVGAALQAAVLIASVVVISTWIVAAHSWSDRGRRLSSAIVMVAPALVATAVWWVLHPGGDRVWASIGNEADPYNVAPRWGEGLEMAVAIGRRALSGFLPVPRNGALAVVAAVVVGILVVGAMIVRRRDRAVWPVVIGLPVAAGVLVVAVGVSRVGAEQGPDVSRYVHLPAALLLPAVGCAINDLVTWAGGRGRREACVASGSGRRRAGATPVVAGASVVVWVASLVAVGASRTGDAAGVVRTYAARSRAEIGLLLADPALALVPDATRVSVGTLDLDVGHLRRLEEDGWLIAEPSDDLRLVAEVAARVHVRATAGTGSLGEAPAVGDLAALAASGVGLRVIRGLPTEEGRCLRSSGTPGGDVWQLVLADGESVGVTVVLHWVEPPRRVRVGYVVDGVRGPWRDVSVAPTLELDVLRDMPLVLDIRGAALTC